MQIREATTADAERVAPLLFQCLSQHEAWDAARYGLMPDIEREYRRWFGKSAEDPRTTILIAEDDGRAIGYLIASVHHDRPIYRTGEYAVIHDFWVEEGSAVAGRELLDALARHCADMDITQLRAATALANERIRGILQDAGFRICQIDLLKELPKPKGKRAKP